MLLTAFEEYLQDIFMQDYPMTLDDDMPDAFSDWLARLDKEDILGSAMVFLNKVNGRELKAGYLELNDEPFKLADAYCKEQGIA